MRKEDVDAILLEVRANRERLDACVRHVFDAERGIGKRIKCSRCGGVVMLTQAYWYELGWGHALEAAARRIESVECQDRADEIGRCERSMRDQAARIARETKP